MELLPFPVHVIIKSPWFGWRDTDRGSQAATCFQLLQNGVPLICACIHLSCYKALHMWMYLIGMQGRNMPYRVFSSATGAIAIPHTIYGIGIGPVHNVLCNGTERNITQCLHSTITCPQSSHAAVLCKRTCHFLFTLSPRTFKSLCGPHTWSFCVLFIYFASILPQPPVLPAVMARSGL